MIKEQDILKLFIEFIEQQIETLEDTEHDKDVLDGLKLLLSDNVTENGEINVRSSLMNKHFHVSFTSYKDHMRRFVKEHLNN
ncbi:poly(3-hydroxyalkanoate) synthetase [Candidatus Scalindua japonica]|uniref:Poly(3-hydroxyalkanoate) synthetase n=1 Tax=Candidatus Scalindua japonica TaxID=1284222 RepID=A0A286U1T0_9BACT|nr:hypothetical protein [Candidatus Scalindua japonica]GAX62098.1 poly(3-hydroxyalkanoate) synthetase [Candidatus Scalindua japonica]